MSSRIYNEKKRITCSDTNEVVTGDRYLLSKHWQGIRDRLLSGDIECERCHSPLTKQTAQLHHNTYKRIGREKDSDLNILCKRCHSIVHKSRRDDRQHNHEVMQLYRKLTKSERKKVIEYMLTIIDKR